MEGVATIKHEPGFEPKSLEATHRVAIATHPGDSSVRGTVVKTERKTEQTPYWDGDRDIQHEDEAESDLMPSNRGDDGDAPESEPFGSRAVIEKRLCKICFVPGTRSHYKSSKHRQMKRTYTKWNQQTVNMDAIHMKTEGKATAVNKEGDPLWGGVAKDYKQPQKGNIETSTGEPVGKDEKVVEMKQDLEWQKKIEDSEKPLIGMQCVIELVREDPGKRNQFWCRLCRMKQSDPVAHAAAYKHRMMYVRRFYPKFVKEIEHARECRVKMAAVAARIMEKEGGKPGSMTLEIDAGSLTLADRHREDHEEPYVLPLSRKRARHLESGFLQPDKKRPRYLPGYLHGFRAREGGPDSAATCGKVFLLWRLQYVMELLKYYSITSQEEYRLGLQLSQELLSSLDKYEDDPDPGSFQKHKGNGQGPVCTDTGPGDANASGDDHSIDDGDCDDVDAADEPSSNHAQSSAADGAPQENLLDNEASDFTRADEDDASASRPSYERLTDDCLQ